MAVKKEDLCSLTAEERRILEELEFSIDKALLKKYTLGEIVYQNIGPHLPPSMVMDTLKRRYQEAGWMIKFRCSRGIDGIGAWVEMS